MLTLPSPAFTPLCGSTVYFALREKRTNTYKTSRVVSPAEKSIARVWRQLICRAAPVRRQGSGSPGPSVVRDPQETELAAADQQAKRDLYAQLLERQQSSRSGEVSSSNVTDRPQPQTGKSDMGTTELIFRLERRGEGWGEEIFPHLVVEQRPWTSVAKRDRNRSSRPKPWTVIPLTSTHMFVLFFTDKEVTW